MNRGYVKIWRKITDWGWYTDVSVFKLMMHIVLHCNWKDKEFQGISIKRGQFLTSIPKLAIETGLSEKQVRNALIKLEKTGEVGRQTTNKYSIITLCNYKEYQEDFTDEFEDMGRQRADKGQTKGRQRADKGQQLNINNIITLKKEVDSSESTLASPEKKSRKSVLKKQDVVLHDPSHPPTFKGDSFVTNEAVRYQHWLSSLPDGFETVRETFRQAAEELGIQNYQIKALYFNFENYWNGEDFNSKVEIYKKDWVTTWKRNLCSAIQRNPQLIENKQNRAKTNGQIIDQNGNTVEGKILTQGNNDEMIYGDKRTAAAMGAFDKLEEILKQKGAI